MYFFSIRATSHAYLTLLHLIIRQQIMEVSFCAVFSILLLLLLRVKCLPQLSVHERPECAT